MRSPQFPNVFDGPPLSDRYDREPAPVAQPIHWGALPGACGCSGGVCRECVVFPVVPPHIMSAGHHKPVPSALPASSIGASPLDLRRGLPGTGSGAGSGGSIDCSDPTNAGSIACTHKVGIPEQPYDPTGNTPGHIPPVPLPIPDPTTSTLVNAANSAFDSSGSGGIGTDVPVPAFPTQSSGPPVALILGIVAAALGAFIYYQSKHKKEEQHK